MCKHLRSGITCWLNEEAGKSRGDGDGKWCVLAFTLVIGLPELGKADAENEGLALACR